MQMGTTYLEYGIPVLKRRKIAKYYMKTVGFRLDLLSLLPLDLIQIKVGTQPMLRFPRFIKLHRFLEWKMSIGHLCRIPSIWRLFHLLHLLFLGCHWCACLYFDISAFEQFKSTWGFVPHDGSNTTLFRVYLVSFYWATLALTTIGIEEPPTTNLEFIFTCLAYLFGLFVFATVVGQVGSIINSQNAARVAFEEVLDNVKNYMRLHSVRDDLQSRILRWYDYAWQKKSMNGVLDVASLEMLPEKLKTELVMDVNYETLRKIAIFKECRPEFLHDLVLKMRPILFTPGDYVCRKGEIAREMFIIADGVLEVLGPNNEVLAMMASGDMFGEIGVLRIEGQNKRTADVRAVGYTELYVLSRDDIMEALEDHPEAEMFMKDAARRRLYGSGGGPRPRRSLSASQYQGPSTSTQETRKLEIGFRTSERQSHIEANISDLVSQVESTRVKNTLENFSKTWQTLLLVCYKSTHRVRFLFVSTERMRILIRLRIVLASKITYDSLSDIVVMPNDVMTSLCKPLTANVQAGWELVGSESRLANTAYECSKLSLIHIAPDSLAAKALTFTATTLWEQWGLGDAHPRQFINSKPYNEEDVNLERPKAVYRKNRAFFTSRHSFGQF
ncbi:Cyclic nucleotide-gated cation channel alpha-3 [Clonorchis sinensis]|uniref:Cyclic nucleotide-gated cation channel alpha-3 n=1 Tax=Clonorchis sinensis TaxID=79923 RepID=A0A3R7G169_CLOSI|nr:Cyclic nucleotide-gated cation channel alpha-3 [Clonorchis sinensis]